MIVSLKGEKLVLGGQKQKQTQTKQANKQTAVAVVHVPPKDHGI